jgi:HEAT repeat protein
MIISLLGLATAMAVAAPIPSNNSLENKKLERLHSVLNAPIEERLRLVKELSAAERAELEVIAFSDKESVSQRWRAITLLGRAYPQENREFLEKALKSKEWFLRNAAVTVLEYSEREWAVRWLRIMLHDPALIVRASVVEAISKMGAIETEDLLWEKLYASENYRGGKSLWIRRHILETLTKFTTPEREERYLKLLSDPDVSLRPLAATALEKIKTSSL